jgi:hypothetical protein
MLQHFFKLMLRHAEHKTVHPADPQRSLPAGEAHPGKGDPTPVFLAHILRSALAQDRGGRVMHQFANEQAPKPKPQAAEQADGKVVRLVPRRRPATEQVSNPPPHGDDDDPGPSAA